MDRAGFSANWPGFTAKPVAAGNGATSERHGGVPLGDRLYEAMGVSFEADRDNEIEPAQAIERFSSRKASVSQKSVSWRCIARAQCPQNKRSDTALQGLVGLCMWSLTNFFPSVLSEELPMNRIFSMSLAVITMTASLALPVWSADGPGSGPGSESGPGSGSGARAGSGNDSGPGSSVGSRATSTQQNRMQTQADIKSQEQLLLRTQEQLKTQDRLLSATRDQLKTQDQLLKQIRDQLKTKDQMGDRERLQAQEKLHVQSIDQLQVQERTQLETRTQLKAQEELHIRLMDELKAR